MKKSEAIIRTVFGISLLFNFAVTAAFGLWLSARMKPLPVSPEYMREVIKELSLNSAGRWRVVEHNEEGIIVEYRLPIYDITRYKLPKRDFRLSDRLLLKDGSFDLSFDGCDIYSRSRISGKFECMKFRDLSPDDNDCN